MASLKSLVRDGKDEDGLPHQQGLLDAAAAPRAKFGSRDDAPLDQGNGATWPSGRIQMPFRKPRVPADPGPPP